MDTFEDVPSEEVERRAYRRRLGANLARIRSRLTRYTQESIAEELGIDVETYARSISGSQGFGEPPRKPPAPTRRRSKTRQPPTKEALRAVDAEQVSGLDRFDRGRVSDARHGTSSTSGGHSRRPPATSVPNRASMLIYVDAARVRFVVTEED